MKFHTYALSLLLVVTSLFMQPFTATVKSENVEKEAHVFDLPIWRLPGKKYSRSISQPNDFFVMRAFSNGELVQGSTFFMSPDKIQNVCGKENWGVTIPEYEENLTECIEFVALMSPYGLVIEDEISPEQFELITMIPTLRFLHIRLGYQWGTHLAESFEKIKLLKNLEFLALIHNVGDAPAEDFSFLNDMPNLRGLLLTFLEDAGSPKSVQSLVTCIKEHPSLQELYVYCYYLNSEIINGFSSLKNLKYFFMGVTRNPDQDNFRFVKKLNVKGLAEIDFRSLGHSTPIPDSSLFQHQEVSSVSNLSICNIGIKPDFIKRINEINKLECLKLTFCTKLGNEYLEIKHKPIVNLSLHGSDFEIDGLPTDTIRILSLNLNNKNNREILKKEFNRIKILDSLSLSGSSERFIEVIPFLSSIPKSCKLSLKITHCNKGDMLAILKLLVVNGGLKKLSLVNFADKNKEANEDFSEIGDFDVSGLTDSSEFEELQKLSSLEELVVTINTGSTPEKFCERLAGLPNLRKLHVKSKTIKDLKSIVEKSKFPSTIECIRLDLRYSDDLGDTDIINLKKKLKEKYPNLRGVFVSHPL